MRDVAISRTDPLLKIYTRPHKTYRAIVEYTSPSSLQFPLDVSAELRAFVSSLLTPNPISRLGSRQGAEEAKQHRLFKGFRFEELKTGKSPLLAVVQQWQKEMLKGGNQGKEEV